MTLPFKVHIITMDTVRRFVFVAHLDCVIREGTNEEKVLGTR